MRRSVEIWGIVGMALSLGCQPKPQENEPSAQIAVSDSSPDSIADAPRREHAKAAAPRPIGADEPLKEGLVSFQGMLQGTKGGFDVRGVILDFDDLRAALPSDARRKSNDELLGAKLEIVAELIAHHAEPQKPDEPQIQMRSGDWFSATKLVSAKVVAPAVRIEGVVGRSKGLLTVGKHLVTRDDLDWSLKGADAVGKKVRLWGQPRIYRCPPQAQCLLEGEIPMFDVARAELE